MSQNQADKQSNPKNANRIPKIHRRKNKQIQKQFICTQNCGKAYGSYAALYTHIKNKHGNIKPPQMKTNKPKIGKKGRPQTKQTQKIQQMGGQCRICTKVQCQCVQKYDSQEKNQIIETMADDDFINFTNQIGNLSKVDGSLLVRNTQEQFTYYSEDQIEQLLKRFNIQYSQQLTISKKLKFILSFSSRFWQPQAILELYHAIFVIRLMSNLSQCETFLRNNSKEFPRIIKNLDNDHAQFEIFYAIAKKI